MVKSFYGQLLGVRIDYKEREADSNMILVYFVVMLLLGFAKYCD